MENSQNGKDKEKRKIQMDKDIRNLVNTVKKVHLDKLRILPQIHTIETYDYNQAWKSWIQPVLFRVVKDMDTIAHIEETEKADWIKDLKEVHKEYLERKEKLNKQNNNDKNWVR